MKSQYTYLMLLAAVILLFTITSCAGEKPIEQPFPPPSAHYTIGPADVIRIDVWKEPQLSVSVPVRTDGDISLPLIHDIHVMGLTPLELKEELTKKFSKYVENPTVSVIVEEINSLIIYVVGNVNSPGVFDVKREVNVLQAISMAGGFNEWAKKGKIKIFRKQKETEQIIKINYNKIISGEHPELNIPLHPGDSIVVP